MTVVFVSNFLNHHQIPLCTEFLKQCERFVFIATENVKNVGYQVASDAEYVLHYYDETEKSKVEQLIEVADVVIFGACPNNLIEMRMKKNKLSFLYSERFFKKGTWCRFIPKTRLAVKNRIVKYKKKNMYVLCASAYLPYDLSLLGYPIDKCYRWGYFPEIKKYEDIEKIIELKHPASILWVGRLIELKHPDASIQLAKRLKQAGYSFQLNIIGSGPLEMKLRKEIHDNSLEDCVYLLGSMSSEQVRTYMEQSEIFLFTSDRNEGWGAVLNEAMNSGCAVVASHAIGSVPFLVEEGKNGYTYPSGKIGILTEKVKVLLDNVTQRKEMAEKAYYTLAEAWNAQIAVSRLLEIANMINNTDEYSNNKYICGPCSKAVL